MGDAMKAGRAAKSQGYPAAVLAKWAKADATARLAALAAANDTAGFTRQPEEVDHACSSCPARFKEGAQGPPKK